MFAGNDMAQRLDNAATMAEAYRNIFQTLRNTHFGRSAVDAAMKEMHKAISYADLGRMMVAFEVLNSACGGMLRAPRVVNIAKRCRYHNPSVPYSDSDDEGEAQYLACKNKELSDEECRILAADLDAAINTCKEKMKEYKDAMQTWLDSKEEADKLFETIERLYSL